MLDIVLDQIPLIFVMHEAIQIVSHPIEICEVQTGGS